MSERRRLPPPEDVEDELELELELAPEPSEEAVEYFVEVAEESWVLTSVPKEAHSSQTSSSAPSTLTVFGDAVSVPHISH
jgi:hypothetical protein